jgi:hypothetical protein
LGYPVGQASCLAERTLGLDLVFPLLLTDVVVQRAFPDAQASLHWAGAGCGLYARVGPRRVQWPEQRVLGRVIPQALEARRSCPGIGTVSVGLQPGRQP